MDTRNTINLGARVRALRKGRGLTLNQLSALIDSDPGNLSRLERGAQGFSEQLLEKISAALGVPVAALFLDQDIDLEALRGLRPKRVKAVDDGDAEAEAEFVRIPMVTLRLSAGVTGFQTEPDRRDGGTLSVPAYWVKRKGLNIASLVSIQVTGESMEPALYEDDVVVLDTSDTKLVDGVVYAFNYEGEAVVKRLSRDAGDWWLTSDNPDRKYHRKICRGEACIVIGRVVRKESDRI